MSKCLICGNELLTGDIHWEQGMCNRCYNIQRNPDPYFEIKTDKRLLNSREEYIKLLEQRLVEKDKEIEELKRYLQLETTFTPMRCDGKTFTKFNVIQDFKKLIRKQVCDELYDFIEKESEWGDVAFYKIASKLEEIEQGEQQ